MKRCTIIFLIAAILFTFAACGNQHTHIWKDATCIAPKTCSTCGETEGEASGSHDWSAATCIAPKTCNLCKVTEGTADGPHDWSAATCIAPKTCKLCKATEGEADGPHDWTAATCVAPQTCATCNKTEGTADAPHKWNDATCDTPMTCSVCSKTEGSAKGHSWKDATCETAKTCSSCGKTEGSALGHNWKAGNCDTAKTCSVCNKTDGSALGHSWKAATCDTAKTCSVCNKTEGSAKGHSWKAATCDTAKTCSSCGKTEGSAKGHSWKAATCDTAKTCSSCGKTEGSALGHSIVKDAAVPATCIATGLTEGSHCSRCNTVLVAQKTVAKLSSHSYVSYVCKYCGQQDPNYIPTYTSGQTWTVAGQWELSFESAVQTVIKNGKQTVEVTWKYKNLGYTKYDGKLDIGLYEFDVYDADTEVCEYTFYDVDYKNQNGADVVAGAKATCKMGWVLNNRSTKIKIYVELRDSNDVTQKAWFELNVTEKVEEEKDKLEGCTITVDGSLPKTISHYNYNNTKQSSCSVTEVHFEVSGDDLYIYFTGRKTYDSRGSGQSDSCKIGWKLYDSNNNVVASGTAYTLSIATGEGFVNAKGTAYNCITPGGTYRLVLLNVN